MEEVERREARPTGEELASVEALEIPAKENA